MKFDLAFVLIDLDEPLYRVAASEMIRSARRAYKDHDMRVVQLTDNRSEHHPDVDGVFSLDTDVKGKEFCQMKGFVMAEYALKADRPVIFCDVDLLWQNDSLLAEDWAHYVAAMFRDDLPAMPINTGVIMTDGAQPFWEQYRRACESLPPEMCAWWGDQVAITAAWVDCQLWKGKRDMLRPMQMDETAPCITELPSAPLTTPAVHFKGDAKKLMGQYARLLDKGEAFDFVRPNATVTVDFAEPGVQRMTYQGDAVRGFTF